MTNISFTETSIVWLNYELWQSLLFFWLWLRSCLRLPTHWFRSERLLQSIEISPQLKRSAVVNKSNSKVTSLVSAWSTQQSPASSKTNHVAVMLFSVCATWSTWSTTTPFIPVAPIRVGHRIQAQKDVTNKTWQLFDLSEAWEQVEWTSLRQLQVRNSQGTDLQKLARLALPVTSLALVTWSKISMIRLYYGFWVQNISYWYCTWDWYTRYANIIKY